MSEKEGTLAAPTESGDSTAAWPTPPRQAVFPAWIALVLTVVMIILGMQLVGQGTRNSVSGGILLLIGALAFGGVALAQGPYGPAREGPLDLSGRLGLGLLGGALGGMAAGIVVRVILGFGLAGPLATVAGARFIWGISVTQASLWGAVFGIVLPFMPRRSAIGRGLLFSVIPILFVLLARLPLQDAGLFGARIGPLVFVPVVIAGLLWGLIAGAVLGWGARTEEAPVSRHLG